MDEEKVLVAMYDKNFNSNQSVKKLQKSGYEIIKLSIAGKDYHMEEHVVGYNSVGDRMKNWGRISAFWGSIWGLLFRSVFFFVTGIGTLIIAGSFVSSDVGMLKGAVAVGSLPALCAALTSIGISKYSVHFYGTEIKAGRLLLLAPTVKRAKGTLGIESKVRDLIAKK